MTTAYEKLRAAVYSKLHPEGVPLEFGCEVRIDGGPNEIVRVAHVEESNGNAVCFLINGAMCRVSEQSKKDFPYTVLGKPLSLADLLRAIKLPRPEIRLSNGANPGFLQFVTQRVWADDRMEKFDLDLSKPLSEQDEGTLAALIKLFE